MKIISLWTVQAVTLFIKLSKNLPISCAIGIFSLIPRIEQNKWRVLWPNDISLYKSFSYSIAVFSKLFSSRFPNIFFYCCVLFRKGEVCVHFRCSTDDPSDDWAYVRARMHSRNRIKFEKYRTYIHKNTYLYSYVYCKNVYTFPCLSYIGILSFHSRTKKFSI